MYIVIIFQWNDSLFWFYVCVPDVVFWAQKLPTILQYEVAGNYFWFYAFFIMSTYATGIMIIKIKLQLKLSLTVRMTLGT